MERHAPHPDSRADTQRSSSGPAVALRRFTPKAHTDPPKIPTDIHAQRRGKRAAVFVFRPFCRTEWPLAPAAVDSRR
eukprot:1177755-Prorocentrum_minimum.AAC.1